MNLDDLRVIDDRICAPCSCGQAWIPLQGAHTLCLACRLKEAERAINHPSQWHPLGYLDEQHTKARIAYASIP